MKQSKEAIEAKKRKEQAKIADYLALTNDVLSRVRLLYLRFWSTHSLVEEITGLEPGCVQSHYSHPADQSRILYRVELPAKHISAWNIRLRVCSL